MRLQSILEGTHYPIVGGVLYNHYYRSDGDDTIEFMRKLLDGTYSGRYFTNGDAASAVRYYSAHNSLTNLVEADIRGELIFDSWDTPFQAGGSDSQEYRWFLDSVEGKVPKQLIDEYTELLDNPVGSMGRTLHVKLPLAAISVMQKMFPYMKEEMKGEQVTLPTRTLNLDEIRGAFLCRAGQNIVIEKILYNHNSELV